MRLARFLADVIRVDEERRRETMFSKQRKGVASDARAVIVERQDERF